MFERKSQIKVMYAQFIINDFAKHIQLPACDLSDGIKLLKNK